MNAKEARFEGYLESQGFSGVVAITVTPDALLFAAPLDQIAVPYADIRGFAIDGYALPIDTEFGPLRVSRVGSEIEWLRDKLWEAYNDAVQKALFVDGAPVYQSRGEYRYEDADGRSTGIADIRLFGNCVLILPPNEEARRIPFCFARDLTEEGFALRLTLDTGETYSFEKLGGYVEGFAHQLKTLLTAFRRETQQTVLDLCPSLNAVQASAIARVMPEGAAASMGGLRAISPAFAQAVEKRIAQSRAAEAYAFFRGIYAPDEIFVGLMPWKTRAAAQNETPSDESLADAREAPNHAIFIAAPGPGAQGGVAAVELAIPGEDAAATFFYRYSGDWEAFRGHLNHAMEAVGFRREVIWIGKEALEKPENAPYRMAIRRTAALRFLRSCFAGRAMHNSADAWRKEVERRLAGTGA